MSHEKAYKDWASLIINMSHWGNELINLVLLLDECHVDGFCEHCLKRLAEVTEQLRLEGHELSYVPEAEHYAL